MRSHRPTTTIGTAAGRSDRSTFYSRWTGFVWLSRYRRRSKATARIASCRIAVKNGRLMHDSFGDFRVGISRSASLPGIGGFDAQGPAGRKDGVAYAVLDNAGRTKRSHRVALTVAGWPAKSSPGIPDTGTCRGYNVGSIRVPFVRQISGNKLPRKYAMKVAPLCAAVLFVLCATAANAQVIYNTSSTAEEGAQRGLGSIISAQGQKNLSNSQAAINLTDARSNQIDNQVKSVNAYWEKKGIYQEHVEAENQQIEAARERYIARRGSLDLSTEEFDRTTGQVVWPKILEQSVYDPYRTKLDTAFHDRSYTGALSGDQYMAATTAYNDWRGAILKQKDEYPSSILQQMLRFLLKVKRELDDNLS